MRGPPPKTYWEEWVATDEGYLAKLVEDVPQEEMQAALEDEDFEMDEGDGDEEEGEEEEDADFEVEEESEEDDEDDDSGGSGSVTDEADLCGTSDSEGGAEEDSEDSEENRRERRNSNP